jgi:nucleoside permease NupC
LWGVGGMLVLSAISALLSTSRRAINLRTVEGALDDQGAFPSSYSTGISDGGY